MERGMEEACMHDALPLRRLAIMLLLAVGLACAIASPVAAANVSPDKPDSISVACSEDCLPCECRGEDGQHFVPTYTDTQRVIRQCRRQQGNGYSIRSLNYQTVKSND